MYPDSVGTPSRGGVTACALAVLLCPRRAKQAQISGL